MTLVDYNHQSFHKSKESRCASFRALNKTHHCLTHQPRRELEQSTLCTINHCEADKLLRSQALRGRGSSNYDKAGRYNSRQSVPSLPLGREVQIPSEHISSQRGDKLVVYSLETESERKGEEWIQREKETASYSWPIKNARECGWRGLELFSHNTSHPFNAD